MKFPAGSGQAIRFSPGLQRGCPRLPKECIYRNCAAHKAAGSVSYTHRFRERVTELRLDKGMNEVQMSLELGNSRNYIHNIASGAILPSMGQFFKLCSYLELEPEEFFDPALAHPSKAKQILRLLENLNDETQEDVKRIRCV